jgi:uncharacterized membrane protein HdeD (DUF308 family)
LTAQQSGIQDVQRAASAVLRERWVFFLVEGVVLLVLGATAVVLPPIATLAVTILFGWLFLVSGIVGLITTVWMRHAPGSGGRFYRQFLPSSLVACCSLPP